MQAFSPLDSTESKDTNVARFQQLDQYNTRPAIIDLDELAATTLDDIECLGFISVGINISSLLGELRSAGATLLDTSTMGLKAMDILLQGPDFAQKFHRTIE
ncbi:hypothetical protein M422DRAFT_250495 [Sphaerobolus stellatus SS14]|uniref:Uncharacterized protein n=1 Tax=Sphaerobolus stellatus (strain SS14) TaxID=990650 RepID=A0A0C9W448_SPHS4|nr:hypothetical protein M422DRAFT_250495 [Sphaerobolus stellatus SS14]